MERPGRQLHGMFDPIFKKNGDVTLTKQLFGLRNNYLA